MSSFWNRLSNFYQISKGSFCRKDIDNLFKRFAPLNKMAAMPMYNQTLKNFFSRIKKSFEAET